MAWEKGGQDWIDGLTEGEFQLARPPHGQDDAAAGGRPPARKPRAIPVGEPILPVGKPIPMGVATAAEGAAAEGAAAEGAGAERLGEGDTGEPAAADPASRAAAAEAAPAVKTEAAQPEPPPLSAAVAAGGGEAVQSAAADEQPGTSPVKGGKGFCEMCQVAATTGGKRFCR